MASNTSLYNQSVTTSWAPLPDVRCEYVSILNKTGADLQLRKNGATDSNRTNTIPDGASVNYRVSANANEIEIQAESAASGVQIAID